MKRNSKTSLEAALDKASIAERSSKSRPAAKRLETPRLPGFDFLQNLVKQAGAAMPKAEQWSSMNPLGSMGQLGSMGPLGQVGQWVAPSLNPEEISKRIEELRTVQFWLEQNARMIEAAIKALEVQRMTLSTLQSMNVPLAQLRDTLLLKSPKSSSSTKEPEGTQASHNAVADPVQWWSNLTQQFTQLASQAVGQAVKEGAADAAKQMAVAAVRQGVSTVKRVASHRTTSPFSGSSARRARSTTRTTRKTPSR